MNSSSLSKDKYFNKLYVNNLLVNKLKADEIANNISFLFTLIIKNGVFENNKITCDIVNNNNLKFIEFSDRPYRFVKEYEGINSVEELNNLFNEDKSENSFTEDPPNCCISTSNFTSAFEINKVIVDKTNNKLIFELTPLISSVNLGKYEGKIDIFIDNSFWSNVGNWFIGLGRGIQAVFREMGNRGTSEGDEYMVLE